MEFSEKNSAAPPVFENVTRMDRSLYLEAAAAQGKRARLRLFALGGGIAAATGLLLSLPVLTVFGIATAVLAVVSPLLTGLRDYQKLKRLHPSGVWSKTVRFYPDRIETDSGLGAVSTASYGSIRNEWESKRMYVLDFGGSASSNAFCKDAFTKGSFEELKIFLLERQRAAYDEEPNPSDEQTAVCEQK